MITYGTCEECDERFRQQPDRSQTEKPDTLCLTCRNGDAKVRCVRRSRGGNECSEGTAVVSRKEMPDVYERGSQRFRLERDGRGEPVYVLEN